MGTRINLSMPVLLAIKRDASCYEFGWLACVRLCVLCSVVCVSVCVHVCMCMYVGVFVLDSLRVNTCWLGFYDERLLLSLHLYVCLCAPLCIRETEIIIALPTRDQQTIVKSGWLFHSHSLLYFDLCWFVWCVTHDMERIVFGSYKNQEKQHEFSNEMKRSKHMRNRK